MNIKKIRDQDDLIHNIMEKSFTELIKDSKNFKYKKTSSASISLVLKTSFIKNSIFDLCETDDLYSAKILFRSLIEHFLMHQYLFMRSSMEQNDDVGEDYYKYCDMNEDLMYLNSIKNIIKKVDPKKCKIDVWKELSKIKNDFNEIDRKGLKYKADQFKYWNIINYISDNVKDSSVRNFLAEITLDYSELSSFVHGGPYGEKFMLRGIIAIQKELGGMAEITFSIAKNIKLTTYLLAFQTHKKYGSYYNQIKNIKI